MSMSQQCNAQTTGNLLRGVSEIQLSVERLGTAAKECGLTEEAIRAATMYPLSSTKIEVAPSASVLLYVNVNSLFLRGDRLCFSSVRMEVHAFGDATLVFTGEEKQNVLVGLWDTSFVASSDRSDNARYITGIIEDLVKRFITDWNFDNKPVRSK